MQTVEMYQHRSGYYPGRENVATHSRKRYRIVSSKIPNGPQPDPALWIVHYSRAPGNDQLPANRIPVTPQVQAMMGQRRFLQSQGQLARKDFLLHDRNNWPTISFPPQMGPQGFAQPQAAYQNAPGRPGFYPPQGHPGAVPPGVAQAKMARPHRAQSQAMTAAAADFALEDEDVSSGDVMDLLTPREVSKMRYVQHHEWMEEIFASPYAISQITPVSLGLGRKGELESLTAGFFDAPSGNVSGEDQAGEAPEATKMEPGKAEEFADRVAKKVADMTAEIEKLKKQHARRMERFNRSSLFKDAELRLREAAADPAETGAEVWRLEGRITIPSEEGETPQMDYLEEKAKYKVDDVVREVEAAWKKQIMPEPKVSCVEKGGLLEKIEPEQKEEPDSFNDMVMDQGDSHLLNQFDGGPGAAPGQAMHGAAMQGDVDMDMGDQLAGTSAENGDWMVNNENKDSSAGAGETSLEGSNFDFTNMDSAGDALAAYTEQHDGLDLPDLENSAFGDAFHASDNEHSHHPDADEMS